MLDMGVPLVASVRFEEGELAGAPIRRSGGHLILLCGYRGDVAVVNDPAAPSDAEVRREYAVGDLECVWLERSAMGYVIVPLARSAGPDFRP
jgi:hypothetical protein